MFFYFGLAQGLGWNINEFPAGILALGFHAAAYIAEIFRGAIQSIDRGQMEAARYAQSMGRIIMSQAFRRSLPPLGNQFIIGPKDSSLVAYIGVNELFGMALSEASANYQPLLTYAGNGLYYLALVLISTFLLNRMEKHLHHGKEGTA
ncbi:ABC-type amino acid transport system permease subunit [Kroppenstedtia sanguinis]|uniref:amino acid ABC transporter permease n=1 Tax=Kroppenstedtia sanguinis TaxID=1380684 RepID=UPI003D23EDAB